jgi:Tfp pilus assembly protein PilO
MSEQSSETGRPRRDLIPARLRNLNLSRRQGMIGPAEIVGLAGSFFILLLVIVSNVYFLAPARSRLERLQLERSRLQSQLRNSQDKVTQGQSTEATVQTITQSLDTFENQQLLGANRGRMSLYDSLNILIRKNGLRNTSGPSYVPLESLAVTGASANRSANTKWQSIYPGIAISMTVEGPYQNLRRFIREIEMNKQFVIINSVELERSTEANNAPLPEGAIPEGPPPSQVSLRLEMATYFQRGTAESVAPEPAER